MFQSEDVSLVLVLYDTFWYFFLLVGTFHFSLVLVLFDTFLFFAVPLVLFSTFSYFFRTFQRKDVSLVLVPTVTPSQVQMSGHKGPPTYPTHVSDADINWCWLVAHILYNIYIVCQQISPFASVADMTCEQPPSGLAWYPIMKISNNYLLFIYSHYVQSPPVARHQNKQQRSREKPPAEPVRPSLCWWPPHMSRWKWEMK